MHQSEIQKFRIHISNMRVKAQNIRWDAAHLTTKAEAIEMECLQLESLVDKLETTEP